MNPVDIKYAIVWKLISFVNLTYVTLNSRQFASFLSGHCPRVHIDGSTEWWQNCCGLSLFGLLIGGQVLRCWSAPIYIVFSYKQIFFCSSLFWLFYSLLIISEIHVLLFMTCFFLVDQDYFLKSIDMSMIMWNLNVHVYNLWKSSSTKRFFGVFQWKFLRLLCELD